MFGRIFQSLQDNAYRAGLISIDSVSIDSKTVVAKKEGGGRPTRFDEEAYKNRGSVKEVQCVDRVF